MSEEGTLEKYVNMGIDRGVEILGLEEIDESQLTDMDDDTNLLIYIRDDGEEDMPSLKHGTWLQVTLYLSVLMVALLLVVAIVYCSKKQEEKSKSKSEEKASEKQINARRTSLQCRPYSTTCDSDTTEEQTDAFGMNNFPHRTATALESSGTEESDSDIEECSMREEQVPEAPEADNDKTVCKLCSESFELGQPVYESNNPQCTHLFHMACMDKWLNLQHTCPVCNHAYAIHVAA